MKSTDLPVGMHEIDPDDAPFEVDDDPIDDTLLAAAKTADAEATRLAAENAALKLRLANLEAASTTAKLSASHFSTVIGARLSERAPGSTRLISPGTLDITVRTMEIDGQPLQVAFIPVVLSGVAHPTGKVNSTRNSRGQPTHWRQIELGRTQVTDSLCSALVATPTGAQRVYLTGWATIEAAVDPADDLREPIMFKTLDSIQRRLDRAAAYSSPTTAFYTDARGNTRAASVDSSDAINTAARGDRSNYELNLGLSDPST